MKKIRAKEKIKKVWINVSSREVTFALLAIVFGSLVITRAFAWTSPGSAAPSGNISAPINSGASTQTKSGSMLSSATIGGDTVNATTTLCLAGTCKTAWSQIGSTQWNTSGTALWYATGSVGIGTSNPQTKLHISGGAITVDNTASGAANIFINASTTSNASISFEQNGTNRASIYYGNATSALIITDNSNADTLYVKSGSLGIGVASPAQKLDVNGSIQATAFLYSSDRRLKTDIEPVAGLQIVEGLTGVTFKWKKDGAQSAGLIAQDVEKVFPEAVITEANGMKAVNGGALFGPVVESIKELEADAKEKDQEIAELKAEIELLKAKK